MSGVFVGENCSRWVELPVDAETAVSDRYSAVGLGVIEIIAFVLKHSRIAQHCKTVGKATRHKKLQMIILRKLNRNMFSVCE